MSNNYDRRSFLGTVAGVVAVPLAALAEEEKKNKYCYTVRRGDSLRKLAKRVKIADDPRRACEYRHQDYLDRIIQLIADANKIEQKKDGTYRWLRLGERLVLPRSYNPMLTYESQILELEMDRFECRGQTLIKDIYSY